MKKMKRILILLLIITGFYMIYNQVSQFDWFSSSEGKNAQATMSKDIDMIEVNSSSVSTTIIPEDRKDVKAVYNGKEKLSVLERGDTIVVFIKQKGFGWFNWSPFSEKKKLEIYIPENYDRNMNIRLGSGNLNFSGQSKIKPVNLEELTVDIGSGNMNLQNLIINRFEQNLASGNVMIDSVKTDTGFFGLSSGNLDIKHYTGAIEADVSSGELDIQMDKLTDSVTIDVSSGEVGLDLPNDADFTLNGDVSSGDISSDLSLTSKELNKHSIKGKHGSGKYKIDLDVSSGDIHIN